MSAAAACSRASPAPASSSSPRNSRRSRPAMAYATGAEKMPHGVVTNPHIFVSIDNGRHRHHRGASRRDGQRRGAHLAADDRRRRARCRLGARARGAVAGRRGDLRQPGHRRLAQRAPLHPADAAGAAPASARCWRRRPPSVGASTRARCRSRCTRSCTRPSDKKLGYGELAADAAALPAPRARYAQAQVAERVPLYRQGHVSIVDLDDITTGKAMYGQDVRLPGMLYAVDRAHARGRRQGRSPTTTARP